MTLKSSFVCRSCFFAVPVKDWSLYEYVHSLFTKNLFAYYCREMQTIHVPWRMWSIVS